MRAGLSFAHSPATDTTMQITTYRTRGMERGIAVYDPEDAGAIGDTIERLTDSRPWEAEDGTLSVECDSPREARAVAAFLREYHPIPVHAR